MEKFEIVDDVARQSFDFDSLKDSLNILVDKSKSISFDDTNDMSFKSFDFQRSPPSNPNSFPLSRAILHDQLFGRPVVARETRHDRSYSVPDIAVPQNNVFDFPRNETISQGGTRSSPGVIGANYSYPSPNNTSSVPINFNGQQQQSYSERHHINLPSLDVNSRYTLPPSLHHVISNSGSYSNPHSNNSPAPTFTGKVYPPNISNPSIAISPSYHAQFAPYTPRSNPMTPLSKSPHGNSGKGRENPNLHYRPNRDVQIANLAKAKAVAEGNTSSSNNGNNSNHSSGNNSNGSSSDNSPVPDTNTTNTTSTATTTANTIGSERSRNNNTVVKDNSETMSVKTLKPSVTYVYTVQQKTAVVYCLISNACSLYALSMNELVVFSIDDLGGEEIGFVSQIVTMKVFCEQFQVSELEATNRMKFIVRVATESDRKETAKNRLEESDIVEKLFDTNNRVYRLPINIIDAQYQLDRKRLTICYKELHEGVVVDGRELMKDLFQLVQTRIVMKRLLSK